MPSALRHNNDEIERVHIHELLGLYINNILTSDDHVMSICTPPAKRLEFLKLLEHAASAQQLLVEFQMRYSHQRIVDY